MFWAFSHKQMLGWWVANFTVRRYQVFVPNLQFLLGDLIENLLDSGLSNLNYVTFKTKRNFISR